MKRRTATQKENQAWQQELANWGIQEPRSQEESIVVWEENWAAIEWWLSVPGFLKFNQHVCLGMDVLAVKADADLCRRAVVPSQYQQLKVIARALAEELNTHE
ncbi:hypothetical protein [Vibrio nigripulchritudo]|uniref:hypothetical protein n=1 Tax=Vibrio nigripulchritudo TaxID=28173 RepID=UPI000ACC0FAB|nr:hypothetical protein [Vibrio nigripulchritudo]